MGDYNLDGGLHKFINAYKNKTTYYWKKNQDYFFNNLNMNCKAH